MKVTIKKPIRMVLDQSQLEKDDGELYLKLKPGAYELDEIEEYDVDGDRISIKVPLTVSFWTTDVGENEYEIE